MTERHPHQGGPRLHHVLSEWRALLEGASLPLAWPLLMGAPRGDGHPVLLLPGFMASDLALRPLARYLRGLGHDVHNWGQGRNRGLQGRRLDALEQRVRHLHHQTGRRVSLVGWSLGGVFAFAVAHRASECVRSIVTLGSPVSADPHNPQAAPVVRLLYRWIAHPQGARAHSLHPRLKPLREPPPVPMSCLYSVGDGIVPPQEATLKGDPARHENIRVPGSHTGMVVNPLVLAIIADRLAQAEGAWQPYQRPEGWSAVCRPWARPRAWSRGS